MGTRQFVGKLMQNRARDTHMQEDENSLELAAEAALDMKSYTCTP